MARLIEDPWIIGMLVLAVVLFVAPKLPGIARSLVQSLRIFRTEIKELKDRGPTETPRGAAADGPVRAAGTAAESR